METKNKKSVLRFRLTLVVLCLMLCPSLFGQDLDHSINEWQRNAERIAKAIIGLIAITGGIYSYIRLHADDGKNGKRAVVSIVGAVLFALTMFYIIDFFLTDDFEFVNEY